MCDGENIYPLEIEEILCKHESVIQACVIPLSDPLHGQVPAAMVVFRSGHEISSESLRQYYLKHGPLYAYPRLIHSASSLPKMGPGKVDRKLVAQLLEDMYERKVGKSEKVLDDACLVSGVNSDVSEFVVDTWKAILKTESIRSDVNVFDLGVSSLQITVFLEKIKETFSVSITMEDFFQLQTIEEISRYIEKLLNQPERIGDYQLGAGSMGHTVII